LRTSPSDTSQIRYKTLVWESGCELLPAVEAYAEFLKEHNGLAGGTVPVLRKPTPRANPIRTPSATPRVQVQQFPNNEGDEVDEEEEEEDFPPPPPRPKARKIIPTPDIRVSASKGPTLQVPKVSSTVDAAGTTTRSKAKRGRGGATRGKGMSPSVFFPSHDSPVVRSRQRRLVHFCFREGCRGDCRCSSTQVGSRFSEVEPSRGDLEANS